MNHEIKLQHTYATPDDARAKGFWRLTNAYYSPQDDWMLTAAIKQLGGISYRLVPRDGGVTIWRAGRMLETGGCDNDSE